MIYDVSHRTTYAYGQTVSISHHLLHLVPRPVPGQRCLRHSLVVEPAPAIREDGVDYFGNPVSFVTIQDRHQQLVVHAASTIEVTAPAHPAPPSTPAWETVSPALAADPSPEALATIQHAFDSPRTRAGEAVTGFARASFAPARPMLEAALDLTHRIFTGFKYDGTATKVSTPVDEVMTLRRGVCQDFAHLEIACLRALGLPARYVSGYLMTHPAPGKEKLVGADASHAWLSVWVPGHGWVDLDPTNDVIPGDEHITVAWGRDYGDVSPVNGVVIGGGEHRVDVAVDVAPRAA